MLGNVLHSEGIMVKTDFPRIRYHEENDKAGHSMRISSAKPWRL